MGYVAIINVPGYLPMADEPAEFDSAREAWEYLLDELERGELRWQPDDLSDPTGPHSLTGTAISMEKLRDSDMDGTVYGPSYLPSVPDEDTSTDLGLAYSVEWAEEKADDVL